MNKQITTALIIALFTTVPTTAMGGAWVKKPGNTYAKLAGSYFKSIGVYDTAGDLDSNPPFDYWESTLRLYSETGIVENLSVGFSLPLKQSTYSTDQRDFQTSGFGDLDLFAKYGGSIGPCVLSGKLEGRIPLYENTDGDSSGTVSGQTQTYNPVLGDGSYELTPMAAAGCPISGPISGWTSLEAGPNFRSGGYGNGLAYAGEVGVYVVPGFVALKGAFSGIQRYSAKNEEPTKTYVNTLASAIIHVTDRLNLEMTGSYIPKGYFVSKGYSYSLGISYNGSLGFGTQ